MLVFLEGTVAVWKTSVLESLKTNHPSWEFLPEPVDAWRNWQGQNWLEKFYSNPKKHAYDFQSSVLQSYSFLKRDFDPKKIYIAERSPRVATHVFSRLCLVDGNLILMEYQSLLSEYEKMYNFLEGTESPKTVYLRTSPEIAWKRLVQRARPEENSVTLEYLTKLGYFHDMEFCIPGKDFIIDETENPLTVPEKVRAVEGFIQLFEPWRCWFT